MSKAYGIGFTLFEFDGKSKRPIMNFKSVPGNVNNAMRLLEKRIRTINKDGYLMKCCIASFVYGIFIRTVLAI